MGAVDFATTIAPGLRDVLLTGKACEVVRRADKPGADSYDAVVLDAPPTGRITRFLNVNNEVSGLAKVGPIKNHADLVMNVIGSPRTAVHLVTLLEEMPVQETIDGVAELRAASLPVGGVLVNMARPTKLTDIEMDQALTTSLPIEEIERGLHDAGLTSDIAQAANVLAGEGRDHALRVRLEQQETIRLDALDVPVLQLPYVSGGIDLSSLYEFASVLSDQGASS
jgi:anion-transporting  ArsA/GET3 family ATPase